MVNVWYIHYADDVSGVNASSMVSQIQSGVTGQDPNAQVQEVRLLPNTVGILINHPTYATARLGNGKLTLVDTLNLPPGAVLPDGSVNPAYVTYDANGNLIRADTGSLIAPLVIAAIIIIAAICAAIVAMSVVNMYQINVNYAVEMHVYTCPGDPSHPETQCGLHRTNPSDPTSDPMTFSTRTEFLAHMASAHSAAFAALDASGVLTKQFDVAGPAWWENLAPGFGNILQYLLIAGLAIGGIYVAVKVLPGYLKRKSTPRPPYPGE